MKYSILLAALLASLNVSAAENTNFATVQYTFRDSIASNSGDSNRQGVNFTLGKTVLPGITLDVGSQFRTERLNSDQGASSTRLEAGATFAQELVKDVTFYARGAVGQKFTESTDHTYYSIEPGVKVALTSALSVKAAYRYRTAFNDSVFDKTNTVRVGAEYALDKTSALTLGVDRAYGDSEFLGVNAGYLVKF